MFDKDRAIEIIKNYKANKDKLDSCNYHDFSIDRQPRVHSLSKEWACSKCGGVVTQDEKYWYEKGLCHSRVTK